MSPLRMKWLEFALRRAGFDTLNIAYPSLKQNIENCAAHTAQKIAAHERKDYAKTHFVTHSMGCLVALEMMQRKLVGNVSRAILIAPPYRGSEVADLLAHNFLYRRFFGPAGQQLTTRYRQNINYTIPENIEIGVIAGTLGWEYPWFLSTMKKSGQHDGLVSLKSTEITGVKDSYTIRTSHSHLIEKLIPQIVHFLDQGRFNHPQSM